MGLVATAPRYSGDWLRHELDPRLYREEVTIASGAGALKTGTVLGKVTASGKYVPHVNGAVDGTEAAARVLLHAVDATSADATAVVVMGNAEIVAQELVWDASVDNQGKKDAALAQLAALGFKVRALA